jgi:hypothetical protein
MDYGIPMGLPIASSFLVHPPDEGEEAILVGLAQGPD